MKNITSISRRLSAQISLAACLLAPLPAAQAFTYTPGDLLLGMRQATGGSWELVVDLGSPTAITNAAPGSTFAITNYSNETLTNAFSDLGGIDWSVTGSPYTANNPVYANDTLWATRPRPSPNQQSTPWTRAANHTQAPTSSKMEGLGNNAATYAKNLTLDGVINGPTSIMIPAGNSKGYLAEVTGNGDFGYFDPGGVESLTASPFADTNSICDLYYLAPGSGPAAYWGYFTFSPDGSLTFTVAPAATPPPSLVSLSPTNGSTDGGTVVTLTGSNLVSGLTVSFGGVLSTTVNFISSTTVSAASPSHAVGAVSVVVKNPDGQTSTLANSFTYVAPAPSITSISPTSGTTAGGDLITINGADFVGGLTVKFGGVPAPTVNFSNATLLTAMTPPGVVGPADVTVINPDLQSSSLAGGFMYVNPAPSITSISPTNGSTAGGDLIAINGANFISGLTVEFGGVPAPTVNFINATLVTAVTPPGAAGPVDVTLINPDTQSSLLMGGYSYVTAAPPAPPQVSSFTQSGNSLIIVIAGATNAPCVILTSTDLGAPLNNWKAIVTNTVGASGLSTNSLTISPADPMRFYLPAILSR